MEVNLDQISPVEAVNEQIDRGEDLYTIEHTGTRTFAKTAATEYTYKVKFNDQWQGQRLVDIMDQLNRLFIDLLNIARQNIHDDDLLIVIIRHPTLNNAVVIPLTRSRDLNVQTILDKIESILQSEESLDIVESFEGINFLNNDLFNINIYM